MIARAGRGWAVYLRGVILLPLVLIVASGCRSAPVDSAASVHGNPAVASGRPDELPCVTWDAEVLNKDRVPLTYGGPYEFERPVWRSLGAELPGIPDDAPPPGWANWWADTAVALVIFALDGAAREADIAGVCPVEGLHSSLPMPEWVTLTLGGETNSRRSLVMQLVATAPERDELGALVTLVRSTECREALLRHELARLQLCGSEPPVAPQTLEVRIPTRPLAEALDFALAGRLQDGAYAAEATLGKHPDGLGLVGPCQVVFGGSCLPHRDVWGRIYESGDRWPPPRAVVSPTP